MDSTCPRRAWRELIDYAGRRQVHLVTVVSTESPVPNDRPIECSIAELIHEAEGDAPLSFTIQVSSADRVSVTADEPLTEEVRQALAQIERPLTARPPDHANDERGGRK